MFHARQAIPDGIYERETKILKVNADVYARPFDLEFHCSSAEPGKRLITRKKSC